MMLPLALSKPEHTAYIIFTSGSTRLAEGDGRADRHREPPAVDANHYPLTAADVVAQKTPCSFDVSVWEFWWPFMTGAQLVMAAPEAQHRRSR